MSNIKQEIEEILKAIKIGDFAHAKVLSNRLLKKYDSSYVVLESDFVSRHQDRF